MEVSIKIYVNGNTTELFNIFNSKFGIIFRIGREDECLIYKVLFHISLSNITIWGSFINDVHAEGGGGSTKV